MKRPSVPKPSPSQKLRVLGHDARSLRLASRGSVVEVSAIASDLLRLRMVRGRSLPATPSWSVVVRDRPETATTRVADRSTASFASEAGTLVFRLATGAWELRDRHGLLVFSAGAGATAFVDGRPGVALDLVERESVFGLGEATGQFNRRGLVREFWNIDVLGHSPAIHPALPSLYVSIPFALSLRDGRAAGIFWDSPAKQTWDIGQTRPDRWQMSAASGEIDLYLFLGPTVPEVTARYADLTGHMPMPPMWALGFHQSRYSYETRGRVEEIAREFRRRELPCDVIHLDIHHLDGNRVFTFGPSFPKPEEMTAKLARQGFKVVAIVDPGVKDEADGALLQRGVEADAFVKEAGGKQDALGEAWPGVVRFPDFLREATRTWWGDEQKALLDAGVAGFWNDMDEPANFARPDKTLAPDTIHRTDHGPRTHAEVHNLYGSEMARASRDGALRHAPDKRPFVITRAGYAGVQRHALVWTGDNSSHWGHLDDAVQMLLNLSLSGVPFCGSDVGGFLGNATPELFARWFQFAAFTPFFRGHTNIGTIDHEPWAFGPEVEDVCRRYLGLRYQLLPYLYGLAAEAGATGAPIMRPLFWHHPNDPVAVACGDQFLLGRDLLVAPILRQGAVARSVYLPNDLWIDFWTGEKFQGGDHVLADAPLDSIPLYVRAGAVIPMAEPRQHVGAKPLGTVVLNVWPGGSGSLDWYEDDGVSRDHEQGGFSRRTITSRTVKRKLELRFGPETGGAASAVTTWRLVVWGVRPPARLKVDGRPFAGTFDADNGIFVAELPNPPSEMLVELSGV